MSGLRKTPNSDYWYNDILNLSEVKLQKLIAYLKNLKDKVDRQVGSDFVQRILQYQGAKGLVNLVNVSLAALQEEQPARLNYLPPCLFVLKRMSTVSIAHL